MASDGGSGGDAPADQEQDPPRWHEIKNQITAPSEAVLRPNLDPLDDTDVQIIPRQQAPDDEPAHLRLERDIPRPLDDDAPTQYVDPPAQGTDQADVTGFVPEQAFVSLNNLPRLLGLMNIPREHPEWVKLKQLREARANDKNPKQYLKDERGQVINITKKRAGKRDEKVPAEVHQILPRRISSAVEGWRMAMWLLYDRYITMDDIQIRIREPRPNLTTLNMRVARWRKSEDGGQFTLESRQKKSDPKGAQEVDVEIAKQHFPDPPEDLDKDNAVNYLNSMAREGTFNGIFWNSPWKIFRYINDKGQEKVLVQQKDPRYKNLYFEADQFDGTDARWDRPLHALWESYFPPSKANNDEAEDIEPDHLESDFNSILGIVRRLDAECRSIDVDVLDREEIRDTGRLDFSARFAIQNAGRLLSKVTNHLNDHAVKLGFQKKWNVDDLFKTPLHGKIRDINTSPRRAAERVRRTIESLHDELFQKLESWNSAALGTSKLKPLTKQNGQSGTNPLRYEKLDKTAVLKKLVIYFGNQYKAVHELSEDFQGETDVEGKKTKGEIFTAAAEQLIKRMISSYRMQAEFLELPSVYYLKPFEDQTAKQQQVQHLLYHMCRIMRREIKKYPKDPIFENFGKGNLRRGAASEPKGLHNQLREESLEDYRGKKRKMEEERGGPQRKKQKVTPLSPVVGTSPTSPYNKIHARDRLNADRLIADLDQVLLAHDKRIISATHTTFADRLSYAINYLGFEDVMGHYRISAPVLQIIEGKARSAVHRNAREPIARAVDDALLAARYIGASLQPSDSNNNMKSFYTNVANALREAMPMWVAHVRFNLQNDRDYDTAHPREVQDEQRYGTPSPPRSEASPPPIPRVSSLQQVIGKSPTSPYSGLPADDQLNLTRLNQELDLVLQKHGKTMAFESDDSFITRIQQVVSSGYEDVMGHYRIAAPIIRLLRDSGTQDSDKQTLATAVDDALLAAGYTSALLRVGGPAVGQYFSDVADRLETVLEMWVAQVRFEIQNDENYALAHPNQG